MDRAAGPAAVVERVERQVVVNMQRGIAKNPLAQGTLALAAALLIAGCGGGAAAPISSGAAPASQTTSSKAMGAPPMAIKAAAGMPVPPGDASKLINLAVLKVPARPNPFALTAIEGSYEMSQLAENLAGMGSFPMYYQPPPEVLPLPEVEPQPYRRLAGILIGDSVTALIDMGNGQIQEVHPGQRIQGTEWMVQSIDSEKAVLRRVGSRKLPQEVVVRLESAPPGTVPTFNPGNNPGGNPQPNQNPGAQPGVGGRGRAGRGGGGGGLGD